MNPNVAFGHWLAGFTDGEGSFFCALRPRRNGREFYGSFAITLRVDDLPVLREVHAFLGVGNLYERQNGRWSPQCRLLVQNQAGRARVIEVFDAYPLRAKKAIDYALWREAVRLADGPRELRDLSRIRVLAAELKVRHQPLEAVA